MFEYEFATCPVQFGSKGKIEPTGYRKIIQDKAKEGWRLVQILVPVPAAVPTEYELIFERLRPA